MTDAMDRPALVKYLRSIAEKCMAAEWNESAAINSAAADMLEQDTNHGWRSVADERPECNRTVMFWNERSGGPIFGHMRTDGSFLTDVHWVPGTCTWWHPLPGPPHTDSTTRNDAVNSDKP